MLAANHKTKNYNISAQANNKGILFLFLEHLCSKGKNPFYTHFSVFENIRLALYLSGDSWSILSSIAPNVYISTLLFIYVMYGFHVLTSVSTLAHVGGTRARRRHPRCIRFVLANKEHDKHKIERKKDSVMKLRACVPPRAGTPRRRLSWRRPACG